MTEEPKHEAADNGAEKDDAKKADKAEPVDDLKTTHHTLGKLAYTATTGRIVLREEITEDDKYNGRKAKAEVSITWYTLNDADVTERPVTFSFNGGPGSSLGVAAPGRARAPPRRLDDEGTRRRRPYGLVDNEQSLLDDTDLVFIDPVGTGFSRMVEGEKASEYHGSSATSSRVGEIIRLWTTRATTAG